MKTVAIATQKGGEGKTTTSVHLAFAAAEENKKVLFIDFDTQGNSTLVFTENSRFAEQEDYSYLTCSDLFSTANSPIKKPYNVAKNIDLIAPDDNLKNYVKARVDWFADELQAPRWVLSHIAKEYDLCIIDAPPAVGQILAALLTTADYVLSPMCMDSFSLDGLAELLETIDSVKNTTNSELKHMGIIPSQINTRSKTELDTLKSLREAYGSLITPYEFYWRYPVKMAIAKKQPVWKGVKGSSHRATANQWKKNCSTILKEILND